MLTRGTAMSIQNGLSVNAITDHRGSDNQGPLRANLGAVLGGALVSRSNLDFPSPAPVTMGRETRHSISVAHA
jgi:hypothetical protein